MKITTLNIQAAGLRRASALLAWLDSRDDDVVILTETSRGPGTRHLLDRCHASGWDVIAPESAADRGCAVLSRLPIRQTVLTVSLPGRCAAGILDTDPALLVVGIYVPSNDRTKAARKRTFLADVEQALTQLLRDGDTKMIVGGDYNLITRDHLPAYPGVFADYDYAFLDALAALDLVDAHRHLHPDDQPHSWVGHRGHPYRYDYFHVTASLASMLTSSTYLHHTREAGMSDHAAVSVELAVPTAHLPRAEYDLVVAEGRLF